MNEILGIDASETRVHVHPPCAAKRTELFGWLSQKILEFSEAAILDFEAKTLFRKFPKSLCIFSWNFRILWPFNLLNLCLFLYIIFWNCHRCILSFHVVISYIALLSTKFQEAISCTPNFDFSFSPKFSDCSTLLSWSSCSALRSMTRFSSSRRRLVNPCNCLRCHFLPETIT